MASQRGGSPQHGGKKSGGRSSGGKAPINKGTGKNPAGKNPAGQKSAGSGQGAKKVTKATQQAKLKRVTRKSGNPGGKNLGKPEEVQPFRNERYGQALGPVKRRRRGPSKPVTATPRVQNPEGERLQKVMAHAGVASRRESEELIETGRVEVNGEIVRELGVRVDPGTDVIHVDGVRLQLNEDLQYFAFNKPAGVVSSMNDPENRPDLSDFLREGQSERLYHVGRLDFDTEGLLLLTNDGELTHRLTHPSFEVPKTYLVQVKGPMPKGIGAQLREGVKLEDGVSNVDSFRLVDSTSNTVLVEVVIHSGKNRIVRRMFDAVGFPVKRLVRTQIGPIRLNDQRQGSIRRLGKQEVGHLLAEVGL